MKFPIDLSGYEPLSFQEDQKGLSAGQRETLAANVALVREAIVFFTALASGKGLGGHTGGAFDIVPEVLIADGFIRGTGKVHPIFFDEAGHRVALQYIMAVLNGHQEPDVLLQYREFGAGLYGHPEREDQKGIFFSSGRLGHLWSYVNGVAEANPDQAVLLFGSDGSQQEGGDAEAARYSVSRQLKVKLVIDDNDVTIAGHPSEYMPGYSVARTLEGHGLTVDEGPGEDLDGLFERIRKALFAPGPVAVVNKRAIAVGIAGFEGLCKAHDVITVPLAVDYLKSKGQDAAVAMLEEKFPKTPGPVLRGSSREKSKNRDDFGKIVCDILKDRSDRQAKVLVVDSDLEGSCGLHHIGKAFPEIYVHGGIMERNNFSVAAGFGSTPGRQGIFGTFSAFQEMLISEITMARLNQANVLAHFSHSGVDDMADNTCHFGVNNFFADNGLPEGDSTRLYYPADGGQLKALLEKVFDHEGLRFVFTTRSAVPRILTEDGRPFYDDDYTFTPGRDEVIREGEAGYVVTYGEMLYRCLDVVETLREKGVKIGLINKSTLNVVDEDMLARIGAGPFVLTVETQNATTGLGARLGTWLLERGLRPKYAHMGSVRAGEGGLTEQIPHQGMGPQDIHDRIMTLIG